MSRTSEHDPSPGQPTVEEDPLEALGFDVVERGDDQGPLDDRSDIPDEGPLDPSVFDGLFADLETTEATPERSEPDRDDPGDNGSEAAVGTATDDTAIDDTADVDDTAPDDTAIDDTAPDDTAPDDTADVDGTASDSTADVDGDHSPENTLDTVGPALLSAFDPEVTLFDTELSADHDDPSPRRDVAGRTNDIYSEPGPPEPIPILEHRPAEPEPATPPLIIRYEQQPPAERRGDDAEPLAAPRRDGGQREGEARDGGDRRVERWSDRPASDRRAPQRRRRWPAFAIATGIGATIGIGGAVVLSQLLQFPRTETAAVSDPAAPLEVTAPTSPEASDTDARATQVGTVDEPSADLAAAAADGRLDLNTIRFVPGTVELTDDAEETIQRLATVIETRPDTPISITVRTYSERDAAGNLALSIEQAEALAARLVELGAEPGRIGVSGLGSPLLSPSQPVQNFVIASAGLPQTPLKSVVDDLSPFAVGVDPATLELRAESIASLDQLGAALSSTGQDVGLAAYSFGQADETRNRELAGQAVEAVAAYLVDRHGVDRERISALVPGQAPYVVGAELGNHVELHWGDDAAPAVALQQLPQERIGFVPGTATLTTEGDELLDEVAAAITGSEHALVVDVQTFSEPSKQANAVLSGGQAEAVAEHLLAAGVPAERLRVFASGDVSQFADPGRDGRVILTLLR